MAIAIPEHSKEIERIHRVLAKLELTTPETDKLLTALLEGASKFPVSISVKSHDILEETGLPRWIPESLKKHLSLDIPENSDYIIDLSSLFMLSPLGVLEDEIQSETILDVCSAPGGKAIIASLLLEPNILWANEKSRERCLKLKDNISRLGLKNIIPLNFDARDLRSTSDFTAKLVIVDAPCTGQALLGKGFTNYSAFGNPQIKSISAMQRGILSAAKGKVKDAGYLLYSTCTFSKEENEENVKWFLKKNEDFKTIEVPALIKYQSTLTKHHCYRLYPHFNEGAGGFTCLFKKVDQ